MMCLQTDLMAHLRELVKQTEKIGAASRDYAPTRPGDPASSPLCRLPQTEHLLPAAALAAAAASAASASSSGSSPAPATSPQGSEPALASPTRGSATGVVELEAASDYSPMPARGTPRLGQAPSSSAVSLRDSSPISLGREDYLRASNGPVSPRRPDASPLSPRSRDSPITRRMFVQIETRKYSLLFQLLVRAAEHCLSSLPHPV